MFSIRANVRASLEVPTTLTAVVDAAPTDRATVGPMPRKPTDSPMIKPRWKVEANPGDGKYTYSKDPLLESKHRLWNY